MKKSARKIDVVLHLISATVLPNIFLFYFYNQNRLLNHLLLEHVLIVAVVLVAISYVVFLLSALVARSLQGALAITTLFWLIFWTFGRSYTFSLRYSAYLSQLLWFIFLLLVLGAIALFLRLYFPSFSKVNVIFRIMSFCLCMLFVFNFIPSITHSGAVFIDVEEVNAHPKVRQDFNVSPELPRPDIYWFHMDGMVSLGTMERHFNQPQDTLRSELEKRGFVEYEDALLTSSTMFSLIALFNPDFYDSFLNLHLEETRHIYGQQQVHALVDRLSQAGMDINVHINPYHEMIKAFMSADYDVIFIGPTATPHIYVSPYHRIYNVFDLGDYALQQSMVHNVNFDSAWHNFLRNSGNLIQLMTLTTPLSIFSNQLVLPDIRHFSVPFYEEEINRHVENANSFHSQNLYRLLIDTFENPINQSPKFVFFAQYYTHTGLDWLQSSMPWYELSYLEGYPASFDFASTTMLNSIDIILERNPNAIIVLQSDHGLSPLTDWNSLNNLGFSEEDFVELSTSVFSAVRIPPQYGGLDELLNPLNISRLLVNRFVGENYTLLP